MLSRTADHLFWMSRYTERAGDMPQAFAGDDSSIARSACEVITKTRKARQRFRCLRPRRKNVI
ncbi:alpha-E domain-containing protein [Polaromonas sp. UC242_47]|uniref:alpha-E domain-containing protein n=1 Tax=Polaromonas sp. UC242_47 TaxID=3374626 RepID=UPI00379D5601